MATRHVLVIGGGGSGLAAAVSAATEGSRVTLLEKGDRLGGSTGLSVGSLTAAGTRHQRRVGIRDSWDALLEDMYRFSPLVAERDDPELRALLARESEPTLTWLERLGVAFSGPYPEPPHRVPRMHNVVPGSRMYIARLGAHARRLGVRIVTGARVDGLLVDDDGSVRGARWSGTPNMEIQADATVLATGDYSADPTLRAHLLEPEARAALPVNLQATGDGHRLGASLGAELKSMDVSVAHGLRFRRRASRGIVDLFPTAVPLARAAAWAISRLPAAVIGPFAKTLIVSNVAPSSALFSEGAIIVNRDGERFTDEASGVASLALQPEARGAIIFDERIARRFNEPPHHISTAPGIAFAYFRDYVRARPDLVHMAQDTAGLAASLDMPAEAIARSVASTTRLSSPYVALAPVLGMLVTTEGGLSIDQRFRVLRRDGTPIDGLFAAGSVGQGGLVLAGHGFHIAWAMTSGRLAGAGAVVSPIRGPHATPGARGQSHQTLA